MSFEGPQPIAGHTLPKHRLAIYISVGGRKKEVSKHTHTQTHKREAVETEIRTRLSVQAASAPYIMSTTVDVELWTSFSGVPFETIFPVSATIVPKHRLPRSVLLQLFCISLTSTIHADRGLDPTSDDKLKEARPARRAYLCRQISGRSHLRSMVNSTDPPQDACVR